MVAMQAITMPAPSAGSCGTRLRRGTPARASWVPDYQQSSVPGQWRRQELQQIKKDNEGSSRVSGRKWWDYEAPTAAVGRPDIQLKAVGIPQLSPGGGDGGGNSGNSGGSGKGGGGSGRGGNGGGDPMKGFTYLFSCLLLCGGIVAWAKKGSTKSLLFSAAAAILLLISASLMHHRSGKLLALATCLVMATVMGQRANRSRKVFPAGIVAILSALMTAGYARTLA